MTSAELEARLAAYPLSFDEVSDEVELARFPSMLAVFRALCDGSLPPTQTDFVYAFAATYGASHRHLFVPDTRRATLARLKRAYPSLVRDNHLFLKLQESFERVERDDALDEYGGVDFIIHTAGRVYHVHAYTNTRRGRQWRQAKPGRHPAADDAIPVEFALTLNEAKPVGQFLLYSDRTVARLRAALAAADAPPSLLEPHG